MVLQQEESHPSDVSSLRNFSFAQITDTHFYESGRPLPLTGTNQIVLPNERLKVVLQQIHDQHPDLDFVISTGDVCQKGSSNHAYREVNDIVRRFGFPMYWTVGNHDNRSHFARSLESAPRENLLTEGKGKISYTFGDDRMKGIVLDARKSTNNSGMGIVSEDGLNWLDSQLESLPKDGKAMIFTHFPFISGGTPWINRFMKVQNGEESHFLMRKHREKVLAVVHGHLHKSFSITREGILYICGPATSFALDWNADAERPDVADEGTLGYNIYSVNNEEQSLKLQTYRVDMKSLL